MPGSSKKLQEARPNGEKSRVEPRRERSYQIQSPLSVINDGQGLFYVKGISYEIFSYIEALRAGWHMTCFHAKGIEKGE